MKKLSVLSKNITLVLTVIILFTSCASTTLIQTNPPGAKIYINDEPAVFVKIHPLHKL